MKTHKRRFVEDNFPDINSVGVVSNGWYKEGIKDEKERIKKIISDWKDTSIKDPDSNIALMITNLMITNGGYINKFDLLKAIEEAR